MEAIMIKDKVAIITGASSGIGEATAKLLASKGAKLELGALRAEDRRLAPDSRRQHQGRAERHCRRVADVYRPEVRARHRELVSRRVEGLPGRCGVRRDEVVRARLHGGSPYGVRHGGD